MKTLRKLNVGDIVTVDELLQMDTEFRDLLKIRNLNKRLCYFTIDETKDFSYEETVKNLKSALNWEIQHPDYMASISEMQALEHDRRIIISL